MAAKSMLPALEQIIKRGGALGAKRDRAWHGPSRPAQHPMTTVMAKPHRALFHEFKGGSFLAE